MRFLMRVIPTGRGDDLTCARIYSNENLFVLNTLFVARDSVLCVFSAPWVPSPSAARDDVLGLTTIAVTHDLLPLAGTRTHTDGDEIPPE